jgi:hypothetical protein
VVVVNVNSGVRGDSGANSNVRRLIDRSLMSWLQ